MVEFYKLEGVSKCYGSNVALENITLNLADNPTAVIGYSGAGKTTLLKILAGLEFPSTGTMKFMDVTITKGNVQGLRREVTMLFQYPLFFNRSVLENVTYGLTIRGVGSEEAAEKAKEALSSMGLEGFENRKAAKLSGGEQQRVALARALVLESKVLLLDEPTANLDLANASLIMEVIREAAEKALVVVSTHNFLQARELTRWAIYLEKGKVVETGATADLFDNPKREETRRFINGSF